jgi:hypothetical protein
MDVWMVVGVLGWMLGWTDGFEANFGKFEAQNKIRQISSNLRQNCIYHLSVLTIVQFH